MLLAYAQESGSWVVRKISFELHKQRHTDLHRGGTSLHFKQQQRTTLLFPHPRQYLLSLTLAMLTGMRANQSSFHLHLFDG